MTILGFPALTGSLLLGIAFWFGAVLLLLLVTLFWLSDLVGRFRARLERRRHPEEAAAFEAEERAAPSMPTLRSGRPHFRLGPLRRYLGQGRVNPLNGGGRA